MPSAFYGGAADVAVADEEDLFHPKSTPLVIVLYLISTLMVLFLKS
jgi:hypothetical protein